jgi:hypothetical protein
MGAPQKSMPTLPKPKHNTWTRQTWRQKSQQRVHEIGQWIIGRRHDVEEEAKQLATSVNVAVMWLRGNTGNLSMRIALVVRL